MSSSSDLPGPRGALLFLALFAGLGLVSCRYDPPPEVILVPPPEGTFIEGDPIRLSFSAPIIPGSLVVRIWPEVRDIEHEMPAGAVPRLERCTVAASPCGSTRLEIDADARGATLTLDPSDIGRPDVPLVLEILPGLENEAGSATGASRWFDFQFKPRDPTPPDRPIDFDDGVYIIVGVTSEPVPVVLTLISDIQALPDGRVALAGAEGDEIGEAPKNTQDPTKLMVDSTGDGFAIFVRGAIRRTEEGERFLESDLFPVNINIGPVVVQIEGMRLTGKVVTNAETGMDRIEGTLSFTSVTLDSGSGKPFTFPAGSTTFNADHVPSDLVPKGTPSICGELCGAVTAQCKPPEGFPGEDFVKACGN